MPDLDEARALADRALTACAGADQVQAFADVEVAAYTRFANNAIIQNLAGTTRTVTIEVVKDQRIGRASTTDVSSAGLRAVAATATDIAQRTPRNPEFVSLAHKAPVGRAVPGVFAATRDATPDARRAKLAPVFARLNAAGLAGAGYTNTTTSTQAVANSLGVRAAWEGTLGGLELKAMGAQVSGYAESFSRDYAQVDAAAIAELAAAKATLSPVPGELRPGTYTVILEPPALMDCLVNLMGGMDAGDVLEDKDSWMVGRIGQRIFSPNLTIVDDWAYPSLANRPFASDGAPTRRVVLIDRGVVGHYVSSTYSANLLKIENTGHDGFPSNFVVMPGRKSRAELIASVERGVLVSRTWYVNTVDPRGATITGLTRDGVFLIEDGKLTKALRNFRFFTSLLTAFADVELSDRTRLVSGSDVGGTFAMPDAKVAKFTFSAETSFA